LDFRGPTSKGGEGRGEGRRREGRGGKGREGRVGREGEMNHPLRNPGSAPAMHTRWNNQCILGRISVEQPTELPGQACPGPHIFQT